MKAAFVAAFAVGVTCLVAMAPLSYAQGPVAADSAIVQVNAKKERVKSSAQQKRDATEENIIQNLK